MFIIYIYIYEWKFIYRKLPCYNTKHPIAPLVLWENHDLLIFRRQYYGWWWPGNSRNQGISYQYIVLFFPEHSDSSTEWTKDLYMYSCTLNWFYRFRITVWQSQSMRVKWQPRMIWEPFSRGILAPTKQSVSYSICETCITFVANENPCKCLRFRKFEVYL